MSSTIKQAIENLKGHIADAYTAIVTKGGTLPATQDSVNLPAAIASIPEGGTHEYIPDTFTQLPSATLISTSALNSGGIDIGIMSCSKIELKIGGAADSAKKAVIVSSVGDSWWIAWVGNEILQSSGVTFSQGTPSYTYSEAFDGSAHTITVIPSANILGNGLRFFGFGDASYNRTRDFYDIKLYSGDEILISHLVPVKRIADSAIGFYDSLRQKFFDYSSYLSE